MGVYTDLGVYFKLSSEPGRQNERGLQNEPGRVFDDIRYNIELSCRSGSVGVLRFGLHCELAEPSTLGITILK